MEKIRPWLVILMSIQLSGCLTVPDSEGAGDRAANLVATSVTISRRIKTAGDAERLSSAFIEHYLEQANRSRFTKKRGEIGALLMSTGSLIAIGLSGGSDLAVAVGFGGTALRQYLAIEHPRGPTSQLSAVYQTACIVSQLPSLIKFEKYYPLLEDRSKVTNLDRIYNNALSSIRNGLRVIYANYHATTGGKLELSQYEFVTHFEQIDDTILSEADEGQIFVELSLEEQNQLAMRLSSSLAQIATCSRMVVNAGY